MFEIISLLLLGAVAGTLAGLLGIGGGIVIVPVLAWLFLSNPDIPHAHLMHMALGTSLATIVFTSISSIWAHQKRSAISWSIVWQLTPGIILGTVFGILLVAYLSNDILKMMFAVFLLLIAIQLAIDVQPSPHRKIPKWYYSSFVGLFIGNISALVGVGGGSLIIPFLLWCNTPMRHAIATSAACALPIALVGTLGYMLIGWNEHLTWSTGYIYWPAVFTIVPASLLCAPLGAKLAHNIPVHILKRFFAALLAVVSINMFLTA